jgi:CRISPR-associated protein Csd1
MLLRALNAYAEFEKLVDSIELTDRQVHLVLCLREDGSVDQSGAWRALSTTETDSKGKTKTTPGKSLKLPAFPGVNSGGKANFLADDVLKVLGIDPKSGEPLSDDATSNAAKSFRHFWQRIVDAHAKAGLKELRALLDFRDRYLLDPEARRKIPGISLVPFGKKDPKPTLCALTDDSPVPLEKRIVTFSIEDDPLFSPDTQLHHYWKTAFSHERFADSSPDSTMNLGVCLVSGQENQPIAEAHRTPIKGVPGLPPIGGYLVSFDDSTPSLRSYGLDKAFQAPVSEQAAAAYALGLNHILGRSDYTKRINNVALCSWVHEDPDMTVRVNGLLIDPTEDAVKKFHEMARDGRRFGGWSRKHFRSVTLASNGGRVVVRRWLDETLVQVSENIESWLNDLDLVVIHPPPPEASSKRAKRPLTPGGSVQAESKSIRSFRSIDALAWSTARTPSDVRPDVYDALYRAAYERFHPEALLPAILHRLRVAAVESGANVRYHANRFALIKLILKRMKGNSMEIKPNLCVTNDAPYNCGRLLAVLDNLQYRAMKSGESKDVGADVLARFYGRASTVPAQVFPSLLQLAQSHLKKLSRARDQGGLAHYFDGQLAEILALFKGSDGEAPSFPGLLTVHEQGRFALGFYQQKAHREPANVSDTDPAPPAQ